MLATSKKKGMSPMQAAGKFAGSLQAANNPGVFGGLALTNPQYNFVGYAKYAATASVAGVAAYYIHERAVPVVQTEIYDRIPVVGEYLNMAPYLSTGIIAGGVVGAAAGYVGGAVGAYLAVIAGAIVTAGGVLEAQAYTSAASGDTLNVSDEFVGEADLAGLALSNPGVFSGIALDNGALHGIAMDNGGMHHLNGIAMDNGGFGDGMAYELADLSMPSYLSGTSANFDEGVSDYAGTSLADALSSGADLSIDEGNAAVIGKSRLREAFRSPDRSPLRNGRSQRSLSSRRTARTSMGLADQADWLLSIPGNRCPSSEEAAFCPQEDACFCHPGLQGRDDEHADSPCSA